MLPCFEATWKFGAVWSYYLLCPCKPRRWAVLLGGEFPFPQEPPRQWWPNVHFNEAVLLRKRGRGLTPVPTDSSPEKWGLWGLWSSITHSPLPFFNQSFLNYEFYLSVSLHWVESLGAGTNGTPNGAGDIKLISFCGGRGTRKQHFKYVPSSWSLWREWGPIFLITCSLVCLVLSSLSSPSPATWEFLLCYWKATEVYLNTT